MDKAKYPHKKKTMCLKYAYQNRTWNGPITKLTALMLAEQKKKRNQHEELCEKLLLLFAISGLQAKVNYGLVRKKNAIV